MILVLQAKTYGGAGVMRDDYQNENVTGDEMRTAEAFRASEPGYRRLFEAAKDGILILEADPGRISDVNPFLTELLDNQTGTGFLQKHGVPIN